MTTPRRRAAMHALVTVTILVGAALAACGATAPPHVHPGDAPDPTTEPPARSRQASPAALPRGSQRLALAWAADGGAEPLKRPIALATDRHGRVYVVDAGQHRVRVLDGTGRPAGGWGAEGAGPGQFGFRGPDRCALGDPGQCVAEVGGGIAVDGRGEVYVADYANHRVQVFDGHGVLLRAWGRPGAGAGEFRLPSGIAVDEQGQVYVADGDNARVQRFDADGRFLGAWGGRGGGVGRFLQPGALALDGDGRAHVADAWRGRIQQFDRDGQVLADWDWRRAWPPEADTARRGAGLAVDAGGRVYAAGVGPAVLVFDPGEGEVGRFSCDGWGEGELRSPLGLAVDGQGDVYVADEDTGRVLKFQRLVAVTG